MVQIGKTRLTHSLTNSMANMTYFMWIHYVVHKAAPSYGNSSTKNFFQFVIYSMRATYASHLMDKLKPLPVNVENMVSSQNASKGHMGFNLAFKELIRIS